MAVLSTGQLTLADWAKRLDPDGNVPAVAELLSQTNEILEDGVRRGQPADRPPRRHPHRPADDLLPHAQPGRADLQGHHGPGRRADRNARGPQPHRHQARDAQRQLGAFRSVRGRGVHRGDEPGAGDRACSTATRRPTRASISAWRRATARSRAPATRRTSSTPAAPRTNNTSIYLVVWGENTVFNIFPKGSKAGLKVASGSRRGERADANGNFYQALRSLYQWDNGLVVKDWRYVVRICNINTANLVADRARLPTSSS
jgi:hypothetical protein